MQGFTYKYGDRPLEGFTIQRAAGRGGFGEVYYALSDSGREVALKAVQGYETIELRGISQCMNLKSPHLVTIFDVKYNEQGRPFVIMEYVNGPNLRDLIDQSPAGLGTAKAAFFLREIAKGLTYLHDRGIVHRDLKPGNVFYEDGYVKIGDYGLSKAISASQHSGQTITVGTVHYMAPEIGQGRYDRHIDIYAMGCMLYEMLTGQTPYLGNSPGEILMKHMMAQPDLSSIEEPFAGAIRKAMAKDPADRFQSVQEMVEAVFGAAHIQQSVSCFSPESLTMVAGQVARKVGAGGPGSSGQVDIGQAQTPPAGGQWGDRLERNLEQLGDRLGQAGKKLGAVGERLGRKMEGVGQRINEKMQGQPGEIPPVASPLGPLVDPKRDPLGIERVFLGVVTAGLVSAGTAFFSQRWGGYFPLTWFAAFLATAGGMAGLLMVNRWLEPRLQREAKPARRLAYGGAACLMGLLASLAALGLESPDYSYRSVNGHLEIPGIEYEAPPGAIVEVKTFPGERVMSPHYLDETALVLVIAVFLTNWWKMVDPARRERISLDPALGAGILGLALSWIFDANLPFVTGVLAGLSLAAQACSPFDPVAARVPRQQKSLAVTLESGPVGAGQTSPDQASRPEPRAEQRGRSYTIDYQTDRSWNGPLGPDGQPILPPGVSPHKRLWALLLAAGWFIGLSGMHRLYVGKIFTGLLWLVTVGLLGIGQLIDAILIATGQFRDRDGRRLVVWGDYNELGPHAAWTPARPVEGSPQGEPPPSVQAAADASHAVPPNPAPAAGRPAGWQPDPRASRSAAWVNPINPFLALLGGLLLIAAMLIGLAGVVSIPVFSFVLEFSPGMQEEAWFRMAIGTGEHPHLGSIAWAASLLVMLMATILLIVARRWAGGAHMIRAAVAPLGMLVSLNVLGAALNVNRIDWQKIASLFRHGYIEEGIGDVLQQVYTGGGLLAGLLLLASILVLAWPPRRPDDLPTVGRGV